MIWKIIGTISAGSFLITGFSVLTDPNCVTAEIGGGRVVGVTCRQDSFGTWSGDTAASLMILASLGLLVLIYWTYLRNFLNLQKIKSRPTTVNTSSVGLKICSVCEEEAGPFRFECWKCGSSTFSHKYVQVLPEVVLPEFKTCPMCAEEIKYVAKKCRHCQHMVEPDGT